MTVTADEFIRRFPLHSLPPGFQRIRYYGFLANCHRAAKLDLCRRLLSSPASELLPPPADYRDYYQALTGKDLRASDRRKSWTHLTPSRPFYSLPTHSAPLQPQLPASHSRDS